MGSALAEPKVRGLIQRDVMFPAAREVALSPLRDALPVCCLWIIPSTLIQDFACGICAASAAARALRRATAAASGPCTSIMSQASDSSSAPSVMTIASSIAASGETAALPGGLNGTLEA